MSGPLATAAALVVAFAALSLRLVGAANWPLTRYGRCGQREAGLGGFAAPDVSVDEDAGVYWMSYGQFLYRFKLEDNSIVGGFASQGNAVGKTSLGVTRMTRSQVAVIDRETPLVRILEVSAVGNIAEKERFEPSFAPHSITYDGAYGVFFATSVDDKRTVWEIDPDGGRAKKLFTLDPKVFGGVEISNMHYASNTGTIFFVCTPCRTIFETTLSGRLRSEASSILPLDSSYGTVTSLTIARTGSPMLLINDEYDIFDLCQEILPPVPVLPPEKAYIPPPQNWFPLSSYSFCGETKMDRMWGNGYTAMVLSPTSRTIWAIVGGRLVEYDITGKLLREVVLSRMQSYGLAGVTSMAWVKKHHLLLGMRKGNRIALVDVAPDPPTDNRADFDYYDYEPPGPEEEEDLIRERNLLEVVSVMTVAPKLLPSDSLGAISYNTLDNTVVFSSSRSPLDGVFMMSLDDGDNDDDDGAPVSGKMMSGTGLSDIASLEGVLYAPRTENFLMWCGSCAEAHEVPQNLGRSVDERLFPEFETNGERLPAWAVTPEGSLMLISTPQGRVTFYCSSGQEGENGLLNVVRSGEQEEVDLVYFWRTVEIQQDLLPDSEKDSGSRNLDSSLFTHLFGTACFDPTFSVSGDVEAQYMCENLCLSNPVCGAYTYDLDEKECAMRQTCNTQVVSLVASSGIRKPGSAPSPAATSDSSQGGSDILPEGDHFVYLLRTACTGDSLAAVAADSAGACERSCSGRSSCGAFSFNFDSRMCYLKTGCAQTEAKDNNISARRTPGPANGRSYTYLPGVGCKDPTTTVHRSTTAQQCQSLCSSDPGCAAFSANLKDCFLKSGCSQQEREPGDLSGIKAPA